MQILLPKATKQKLHFFTFIKAIITSKSKFAFESNKGTTKNSINASESSKIQTPCKRLKKKNSTQTQNLTNLERNETAKTQNGMRKFSLSRSLISNQSIINRFIIHACMKNPIKKVKTLNDQLLAIIIKIENLQNRNEIESISRNGCGSRSGNCTWRGEEEEESEEENPKVLHRQHWEILGESWYWCAFLFFDFNFVSCGK